MVALQNERLRIACNPLGAELCSLQDAQGTEYLWQADPAVWGRHAPVLFPIVGRLAGDAYRVGGREYRLPQHGFARDSRFEVAEQEPDRIVFTLGSSPESLAAYPFQFRLSIAYTLRGRALEVEYDIANEGGEPMPATIGAHPGFVCPLPGQGTRADYRLVFDLPETADRHLLEGGNFNGQTERVLEQSRELPISDDLFDKDALVFKHLASEGIELHGPQGRVLRMEFAGFPYLGIWSKNRTAPFVCLEPWLGLADRAGFSGELWEKEGMHRIAPGERLSCMYCIEIGPA